MSQAPSLERTFAVDEQTRDNFARNAKWCPDGSSILMQCEDSSLRSITIPQDMIPSSDVAQSTSGTCFPQPSPIVDFCWYPFATQSDPASSCFLASVRECPVKLLDAVDGRLRASYKIVDHRERQIAPHSLAFNLTGTKIYCGFEDAIEVFDVQSPGEGTRWRTTPNKKSRDGLKGIISSLAFSSDPSSGVFAAGTLSPSAPTSSNVALFTETTGETPVMFVGNESAGHGLGVRSSVSQVMFNPSRPYLLYASFRRHETIYAWDLRGDVSNPMQRLERPSSLNGEETNQRLRFDIDMGGKWMAIGNKSGDISAYDLSTPDIEVQPAQDMSSDTPSQHAALTFAAHQDAVGSVAFHPSRSWLLSTSGSRHFDQANPRDEVISDISSSDSEIDSDHELSPEPRHRLIVRSRSKPAPLTTDSSVKVWSFHTAT